MSGIALASFRTAATRAAPASWAKVEKSFEVIVRIHTEDELGGRFAE